MATVTVLHFPTAHGAGEALITVQNLQKHRLITLHDAAIVSWPAGTRGPSTRQLVNLVRTRALGGMFWGMLFGLIFFTTPFSIGVGVGVGALGGVFRDYGIDDDFIRSVRDAVTAGTSALFLMTSDAVVGPVADAMKRSDFDIIATNLSADQERRLREAFAHN
jgi:uncharacterized membrane protein